MEPDSHFGCRQMLSLTRLSVLYSTQMTAHERRQLRKVSLGMQVMIHVHQMRVHHMALGQIKRDPHHQCPIPWNRPTVSHLLGYWSLRKSCPIHQPLPSLESFKHATTGSSIPLDCKKKI